MEFKYYVEDFKNQGLLQKAFNKLPKENIIPELKHLLNTKGIMNVNTEDIKNLCEKYKVNFDKEYVSQLEKMYSQLLNYCVQDKIIDNEELAAITHLKNLLGINEHKAYELYKSSVSNILKIDIEKALSDGNLSRGEDAYLIGLKEALRIPDELFGELYKEKANDRIMNFLNNALSDSQLSPDEENQLYALAKSMGINLTLDEQTKASLEKYKLYWQVQNADIPEIQVSINLQKNEKCHFTQGVNWYETRSVTQRVNFGGPSVSFRIAKGLYWRTSSYKVQRISKDVLTFIDSGYIYLTNKRLIFMGAKGSKTILLKKILDFNIFSNGFEIVKDSGKSPFINFENNNTYFNMVLSRLLDEV